MDIINDELNKLRKLMGVHEKGLPHLLWKNKEDLKDEQKQQLEVILIKRISYGFTNFEHLRLKLFACFNS